MKKIIIFLVIIFIGVLGYKTYFKKTINGGIVDDIAVNIENGNCSDENGLSLDRDSAFKIAKESAICSFQGEITKEYSCDTKNDGVKVLSLLMKVETSYFDESGDVCIDKCQISISTGKASYNKICK